MRQQKKTIIVKIHSGLGNQLFQYAFGRALALRTGDDLKLDVTYFDGQTDPTTQYRLPYFNIEAKTASRSEIDVVRYHYGRFSKYYQMLRVKARLFNVSFHRRFLKKKGDAYLEGYWQDERYFSDFKDTIRSELTLKDPLGSEAQKAMDAIKNCPLSVSLHVRRGAIAMEGRSHPYWGICTPEYWSVALKYIESKIGKNFQLFVFSEDIDMARKEVNVPYPVTFVSSPGIKDYEELIFMSMCHHNIIANSSFSWWAAWLNKNPNKIITAPKIWTRARRSNFNARNIVPKSWTRI